MDSCSVKLNEDLTPEQLEKIKASEELERSYSNSWEKVEEEGYHHKFRTPGEKTDFSKLKIIDWDWDFVINDRKYSVVLIHGYPHGIDNERYLVPRGETPCCSNLIPFNKDWEPCSYSFEMEPDYGYKDKWSGIQTWSKWTGRIYRNGELFHTTYSNDPHRLWCQIQVDVEKIKCHPIAFHFYDWEHKEAIGRDATYLGNKCKTTSVRKCGSIYFCVSPVEQKIDDETQSDMPGLYLRWDSEDIKWYGFSC